METNSNIPLTTLSRAACTICSDSASSALKTDQNILIINSLITLNTDILNDGNKMTGENK